MTALKECPRCLFTEDIAVIGAKQCNYCDLHDQLEKNSKPADLIPALKRVKKSKGKYNCIIGISGGLDSSTLLFAAVVHWGLKPLVIHFDNHWNDKIAEQNMLGLIKYLDVDSIVYRVNKSEYDKLNEAFLVAGVPDADIPNDIAMTKIMYETADRYGIKWILNGHDFRTEGSTPAAWTYMDAKYINSVYKEYTGYNLVSYPLFTFADQIRYALKGIKQIRPFHYGFDRETIEKQMIKHTGWKSYGAKHCENIYTEFVGAYLLPEKFGIDKRRVYLSARIRSGTLIKNTALAILENKPTFAFSKFGDYSTRVQALIRSKIRPRESFDRYDFKKYKVVIWILAKLKVVPWTMYVKYCK